MKNIDLFAKVCTSSYTPMISALTLALTSLEAGMVYQKQKISAVSFLIFAALGVVLAVASHSYLRNSYMGDSSIRKEQEYDPSIGSSYNLATTAASAIVIVVFLARRIFGFTCSSGFAGFQVGLTLTNSLMNFSYNKKKQEFGSISMINNRAATFSSKEV